MKKAVISVLAAGAALCILFFAMPWFLPETAASEKPLAAVGGKVYLAENRPYASYLYSCDRQGRVDSVWWKSSLIGEDRNIIENLAADGGDLYILFREPGDSARQGGWSVSRLDTATGALSQAYGGGSSLPIPDGISAKDGVISLTFLKNRGHVSVYQYDTGAKNPVLTLLEKESAPVGTDIVSAAWGGGILYCLLGNGKLIWYGDSGKPSYYPADGGSAVSAYSVSGEGAWAVIGDRVSCGSGSLLSEVLTVPNGLTAVSGTAGANGLTVTKARAKDGASVLLLHDGGGSAAVSTLAVSPSARAIFKLPVFLFLLPAFLAAFLLALLCASAVCRSRRLSARLAAYGACGAYLILCAAGVFLLNVNREGLEKSLASEAGLAGQVRAAAVERINLKAAGTPEFSGSASWNAVKELLATEESGGTSVAGELFSVGESGATVAASDDLPAGLSPKLAYDPETAAAVAGAAEDGKPRSLTVTLHGVRTAVDIRPLTGVPKTLLVTQAYRETGAREVFQSFCAEEGTLAALLLAAVLLLWLAASRVTRPIREITAQMNAVSEGNLALGSVSAGRNEVGDMWRALQETTVSVGIKDYEMNSTVRSFYRFVPRGLEKLLKRASVTEVAFGDMANIKSAVALLSVSNREEVRGTLEDAPFMEFVNACFSAVERHVAANRGLLLTGDFNLGGLKSAFPASADDGVSFGLGLLGEPVKSGAPAVPEYFLLLHAAEFLYGVAGTKDQAFAFLSSAELDFLSSLSDRFRGTGVRMAVTEPYLRLLNKPCSPRYIGFAASGDGRFVFKLYEILDVFSSAEKALRLSLNEKFQEAVQLFYKNDFYLARNLFSAILKADPEDGIARWYLFASEHFFNSGKPEEAVYNLFGVGK